ncbi:hypothetical protein [Bifidobacterium psychraerophilum]
MPDFDDYDDVTTRPRVQAEQHGNTDQERNQRTYTRACSLLETCNALRL